MSGSRRVKTRTQPCDARHARKRLADARKFLELADTVDPQVPGTGELLERQTVADVGLAELLDAATYRPAGFELGQRARDF